MRMKESQEANEDEREKDLGEVQSENPSGHMLHPVILNPVIHGYCTRTAILNPVIHGYCTRVPCTLNG